MRNIGSLEDSNGRDTGIAKAIYASMSQVKPAGDESL